MSQLIFAGAAALLSKSLLLDYGLELVSKVILHVIVRESVQDDLDGS